MKNFDIYLNVTVALVTKNGRQIGLKQKTCHFGPNLRLLETDFLKKWISDLLKNWISAQLNTKKSFQYVVCRGNSHLLLKYILVFACALC